MTRVFFFFSMKGGWIKIPLLAGNHRPARGTPSKWRFIGVPGDGPTLNAGLVALWFLRGSGPVLLRYPIFYNFPEGVGTPCRPPLDPQMYYLFVFVLFTCNQVRNSCSYKVLKRIQDLVNVCRLQVIFSVKL